MSRNYRYGDSDSDEDERRKPDSKPQRSINELLSKALAEAAEPGQGDEEPEVLEAPPHTSNHAESKSNNNEMKRSGAGDDDEPDAKLRKREQEERNKAMMEEEKRVAEMTFDHDALLPFQSMKERAKYIPLRLTYEERKNLRLVNAAINVSDYTTEVDVQFKNKARRHHMQLQRIVAFLSGIYPFIILLLSDLFASLHFLPLGLVAATNYDKGQEVLNDRNFTEYQELIKDLLEIARRYKITNPEKMRSEYGE